MRNKFNQDANQITVRIADIGCRIKSADADFLGTLAERYDSFLSSASPEETPFDIDMRTRRPGGSQALDPADPIVKIEPDGQGLSIRRLDNPFEAVLDVEERKIGLDVGRTVYCFDSFLRILYSFLLPQAGGLLLHGASVKNDSGATVMLGVSGSGKTTLAGFANDTVLSDELVAVRRLGGTFYAFATPFWGEFVAGKNGGKGQLRSIYVLKKDTEDFTAAMKRHQAILETMTCTMFYGPETLTNTVFDICHELATEFSVEELHFKPSGEVFEMILEGA